MAQPATAFGAAQPCHYGAVSKGEDVTAKEFGLTLRQVPPRLARFLLVVSAVVCFVLPCGLFVAVLAALSLGAEHRLAVAAVGALFVAGLGVLAHGAWRQASPTRAYVWHLLLFATALLAWASAVILGSQNHAVLTPYFEMTNMATYIEVDPAKGDGRLLQDAGRLLFVPGSRVDVSRATGFKSTDIYCVAPVTRGSGDEATNFDFWAVGVNCCNSSTGGDFVCGPVADERAFAGWRLMDDSQRGFFRLAVQQAEATYGIKARHPLFFHWMQDPFSELTGAWDTVWHRLQVQIPVFCTLQLFLVVATWFTVVAGSKVDD